GLVVVPAGQAVGSDVGFERDVQPVLVRCMVCHGPGKARAELRLDSRQAATAVLPTGNQAVVPGRPEESEILRRVSARDPKERMPPKGDPLSAAQVEKVRRWIADGAEWPAHWAYRPLTRPTLPNDPSQGVQDSVLSTQYSVLSTPENPIDRFIRSQLANRS